MVLKVNNSRLLRRNICVRPQVPTKLILLLHPVDNNDDVDDLDDFYDVTDIEEIDDDIFIINDDIDNVDDNTNKQFLEEKNNRTPLL